MKERWAAKVVLVSKLKTGSRSPSYRELQEVAMAVCATRVHAFVSLGGRDVGKGSGGRGGAKGGALRGGYGGLPSAVGIPVRAGYGTSDPVD